MTVNRNTKAQRTKAKQAVGEYILFHVAGKPRAKAAYFQAKAADYRQNAMRSLSALSFRRAAECLDSSRATRHVSGPGLPA